VQRLQFQFIEKPAKARISDETKALIDNLLLERVSLAGVCLAYGIRYQQSIDNMLFVIPILSVPMPLSYPPNAIGLALDRPKKRLVASVFTVPYASAVVGLVSKTLSFSKKPANHIGAL